MYHLKNLAWHNDLHFTFDLLCLSLEVYLLLMTISLFPLGNCFLGEKPMYYAPLMHGWLSIHSGGFQLRYAVQ